MQPNTPKPKVSPPQKGTVDKPHSPKRQENIINPSQDINKANKDDAETEDNLFQSYPPPEHPSNQSFQTLHPPQRRRWGTLTSFVALVLVPGALALWYWFIVAADRFVTEAGFVVRSVEDQTAPDMMGGLTGLMGPTSTTSDTAIVLAFLGSRDLVELVNQDVDLAQVWSKAEDPIYAYKGGTIEDLVKYWRKRVYTTHDTTTGLISLSVNTFDPETSYAIATSILTHTEKLVNRLSERARQDAMAASQIELNRAENKLRAAAEAQRLFREQKGSLNPLGSAEALVMQIAALEGELSQVRRQIAEMANRVVSNSPSLERLRVNEAGLIGQIASLRAQSGSDAALMAEFESLELEKHLAQNVYTSALSSLEQARIRAERAQRYLAIYQKPMLAQRALLPNRPLATTLTLLALFVTWSITSLLVRHIRDKMV